MIKIKKHGFSPFLIASLIASLSWISLSVLPSQALVPGPILLSQEQVQTMHQDPERQLKLPNSRAKASCLTLEGQEICPGQSQTESQAMIKTLSAKTQTQVLPFYTEERLQALLVLLPTQVLLPSVDFDSDPIELGPDPVPLKEITAQLPGFPVQQSFSEVFQFKTPLKAQDLAVWYYADLHLGLLTHRSEQGEFVIGVFVAK